MGYLKYEKYIVKAGFHVVNRYSRSQRVRLLDYSPPIPTIPRAIAPSTEIFALHVRATIAIT